MPNLSWKGFFEIRKGNVSCLFVLLFIYICTHISYLVEKLSLNVDLIHNFSHEAT